MSATNTTAPFPPPALPQGKEQWRDEAQRLEGAVLLVVDAFMTKHFGATTKEAIAVINATEPVIRQIRREAFNVLRQHRHKKAEDEASPETVE